jgi:uncharacterized protein (DUF1778 family)
MTTNVQDRPARPVRESMVSEEVGIVVTKPAPQRRAISMRLPESALALIDRAAELSHQDRTEFMLAAAVERAEAEMLDRTSFALSEEAFAAFVDALDNPRPANPKLRRLLRHKPSWQR